MIKTHLAIIAIKPFNIAFSIIIPLIAQPYTEVILKAKSGIEFVINPNKLIRFSFSFEFNLEFENTRTVLRKPTNLA